MAVYVDPDDRAIQGGVDGALIPFLPGPNGEVSRFSTPTGGAGIPMLNPGSGIPSVGPVGSGVPAGMSWGTPASLGYAGGGTVATGGGGVTGWLKGLGSGILDRLKTPEGLFDLGQGLSGMLAGRAAGRTGEANYLLDRNVLEQAGQRSQQDALLQAILADLQQRQFAGQDYQRNVSNALQGGLLQGTQDADISGLPEGVQMGQVSGGLRPSALAGRENLGRLMRANAMESLMNPASASSINYGPASQANPGGPNALPQISVLPQQQLDSAPEPGILDRILSIAGPVTSAAGAFNIQPRALPAPGAQPESGAPTTASRTADLARMLTERQQRLGTSPFGG